MSNTVQNGKGSKRRPGKEITQEDWDEIFGKKEKKEAMAALDELTAHDESLGLYQNKEDNQ